MRAWLLLTPLARFGDLALLFAARGRGRYALDHWLAGMANDRDPAEAA